MNFSSFVTRCKDLLKNSGTFVAWLALLASVLGFVYTTYNDTIIKREAFENFGMTNRPLLEFIEDIKMTHFTVDLKPLLEPRDPTHSIKEPHQILKEIKLILTIEPELEVKNTSNFIAIQLLNIVTDKYTGEAEIRKQIPENLLDDDKYLTVSDQFYKSGDILPGRTIKMRMPHAINDFSLEKECVLHYLILYMNESGNVFDSYFWLKLKVKPITVDYTIENGILKFPLDLTKHVEYIEKHFSTHMYSKEESDSILRIHNTMGNRFREQENQDNNK